MEATVGTHHTDTAGREHRVIIDHERLLERRQYSLSDLRPGLQRRVDAQHGELVTAQPRQQVPFAHATAQALSGLHQKDVAAVMTQAVIDHLEAIQIDEHHNHLLANAAEVLPGLPQPMLQMAAIGQPGE